jgi:YggT family protein
LFAAIYGYLVHPILSLLIWLMIINAVLSWLVAFNVVNPSNQFVNMIYRFTNAVTDPLLRPLRKVIPSLGGMDITPIILILLIQFVDLYVLRDVVVPALSQMFPY